jgi:hypothetical protein
LSAHEQSVVLASEGSVAVRRCCTRHLALACGPMTLALDEDGLRLMARVLDEAVQTLDAMSGDEVDA